MQCFTIHVVQLIHSVCARTCVCVCLERSVCVCVCIGKRREGGVYQEGVCWEGKRGRCVYVGKGRESEAEIIMSLRNIRLSIISEITYNAD